MTRCACPHPDAHACAAARYPRRPLARPVDDPEGDRAEPCDCVCHDGDDLDGEEGW
jgi:hypothetical protein